MTRSQSKFLFPFDPEPQRIGRPPRRSTMAEGRDEYQEELDQNRGDQPRTMLDYCRPNLEGANTSINRPRVAANNFEIKPNIIQMVQQTMQFDGLPDEDPNSHLQQFLEICDTFKINGVSEDAVRLRLFPFSLRGNAKKWLNALPRNSISTWQQMADGFMRKYFPPSRTAKLRADIASFCQLETETLYEAFERWKELLAKCPHHGLPEWTQVQTFYNGLNYGTKQLIDAAAGGSLNHKSPEECLSLFEDMANNHYQWSSVRGRREKSGGMFEVDAVSRLTAKVEALSKKIENLSVERGQVSMMEGMTSQGVEGMTSESCEFVGNQAGQRNDPYSNYYNPGWKNHPNFRWNNNNFSNPMNPSNFQKQPVQGSGVYGGNKQNLEDLVSQFIKATETRQQHIDTTLRNHTASIHNLENQLGQISKLLSERPSGSLPSTTEPNPKDQGKP